MSSTGAHILVFPYPAQGHILPLLDLTHQLAIHNLSITILITPKNLPILTPILTTHPSIKTLVLPFPHHPSIPAGVEHVREIGNHGNVLIISALSKLREPIIQWFESHHNPPVAIISDFFLGWTNHLARQLNIPRIGFFSSGAYLTSVSDYCWSNREKDPNFGSSGVVKFDELPGSPLFKVEHLPSLFRLYRESDPDWAIVKDCLIQNSLSWGCVFNSFAELEGQYMEYLKSKMGHKRVYGVGPLNLMFDPSDPNPGPGSDVLAWLDECPDDGSVVYVCFGSQKLLRNDQMEALANGLEKSETRFVWVVNSVNTHGYGLVPSGFQSRVGKRGIVVKGWAPQVAILSHRALGGFLSHCGWNSVLEAIAAGVMILAWPMEADQFVNARLLVEDMRAAVAVAEGGNTVPDSNVVARVIDDSLGQNLTQRVKAMELRDKAICAVKEDGNSFGDLKQLVLKLGLLQVTQE